MCAHRQYFWVIICYLPEHKPTTNNQCSSKRTFSPGTSFDNYPPWGFSSVIGSCLDRRLSCRESCCDQAWWFQLSEVIHDYLSWSLSCSQETVSRCLHLLPLFRQSQLRIFLFCATVGFTLDHSSKLPASFSHPDAHLHFLNVRISVCWELTVWHFSLSTEVELNSNMRWHSKWGLFHFAYLVMELPEHIYNFMKYRVWKLSQCQIFHFHPQPLMMG